MNVFFLDTDPIKAAQYHADKHVVKMILESAQLLSTAHRVLDGTIGTKLSKSGARLKDYTLPDSVRQDSLYKASHVNHPCAIWCHATTGNYRWLHDLFVALGKEYSYRYQKQHASIEALDWLLDVEPDFIMHGAFEMPPQAMPDDCKTTDTVAAYRNYYMTHKRDIAVWTKRSVPDWYK